MRPVPTDSTDGFYVVAREPGQERTDLPTWADSRAGNIRFEPPEEIRPRRVDVDNVPGAFQLLGLLSEAECEQFVEVSCRLGYHEDAPVSLPHSVRHNTNFNWIVDEAIDETLWRRCEPLIPERVGGQRAVGLNARFRFYRYECGDFFKPHTDGAWPGSRVIDGVLHHDAYGDRLSQMTCLLFLTGGFEGGETVFYPGGDEEPVAVATPKGAGLFFPHGYHPQHCVHAGARVSAGLKVIIRTDVLFGVARG